MLAEELKKLTAHMFWADTKVWETVLANKISSKDEKIRQLLFHYHMTQYAFYKAWTKQNFKLPRGKKYENIKSVQNYKNNSNKLLRKYFKKIGELKLDEKIEVPWSKYFVKIAGKEAEEVTLAETILQVVMHSTYHRAQVNRRLRELEIDPPLVDFITWLWAGQPKN